MMSDLPPYVNALINNILNKLPFHSHGIKKALELLKIEELQQLENYLIFSCNQGLSLDYLAESYKTILLDILRETVYFNEHQEYRYSTFEEVANSVYYNDTYMSLYMHGLLITLFFWPNHLKLYRFFQKTIPKNKKGNYLEIGPGHGYFFLTAVKSTDYDHFIGIDLSDTSIQQTNNLIQDQYPEKNVQLYCVDFFEYAAPEASFDAIVLGEILEHVENPQGFLKKVASLAKKEAYIFVSTCINAPAIDHIYQFKNEEQLNKMFRNCGLEIKEQCILPYIEKTLDECRAHALVINVGYILKPSSNKT